jgi:hypothetical protein
MMVRMRMAFVAALLGGVASLATLVRAEAPEGACTRATADRSTAPTTECTRCHESAMPGRSNFFGMPGRDFGHPVDIDYAAVQASRRDAFVPRQDLPPFLTLVDGRITCLTCHAGGQKFRSSTAADPDLELCLGCHTFD